MANNKLQIKFYTDSRGRSEVEEWLTSGKLDDAELLKIQRYLDLLETKGTLLSKNILKKFKGYENLYELRPGQYRIIFFIEDGKVVILLNYFKKKSDETPKREIIRAINMKNDYLERR